MHRTRGVGGCGSNRRGGVEVERHPSSNRVEGVRGEGLGDCGYA